MKYNVYSQEAPVVVESIPRNGNPNVRIVLDESGNERKPTWPANNF